MVLVGSIRVPFLIKTMNIHYKCRSGIYPRTNDSVQRQPVSDEYVTWEKDWPEYNPPYFTSEHIKNQIWADQEMNSDEFKPQWNSLDGKINRKSFLGVYKVVNGYPLNPIGRTGLQGRGVLGRWGPNHAADPIITRWKKLGQNIIKDEATHKPVLQFVAIRRRDCNEWAIPGGMVDPGEVITRTLKREFLEEALNSLKMPPSEKCKIENQMGEFFSSGVPIYTGYVDDIRNTDNAWIETSAYNFHDEDGTTVGLLTLNAGDDAIGVSWFDISGKQPFYASHSKLLELVALKHDSHW